MAQKHGCVTVDGESLLVSFRYSEKRFAAIKRFPKATFDTSLKKWRLPIYALPKLIKNSNFSPETVLYDFDPLPALKELARTKESVKKALSRIQSNPFNAAKGDLELTELDIVFRLNKDGNSLRAFPKYRSRAKKLLEAVPGVHYLKPERAYFFPVGELSRFVKTLRDRRFSFAVEETAGLFLKLSSELRSRIQNGKHLPSKEDLKACALVPFMDAFMEGNRLFFSFESSTSEQLRAAFPRIKSFKERKERARHICETELAYVLDSLRRVSLKAWFTGPVLEYIQKKGLECREAISRCPSGFSDDCLVFYQPDACWFTFNSHGALLIKSCAPEKALILPFLGKIKPVYNPFFGEHQIFILPDSALCEIYCMASAECANPLPETNTFKALRRDIRERSSAAKRKSELISSPDITLNLSSKKTERLLYPHQKAAVAWLLDNPAAFLGDDMGLGKTLSLLSAFEELKNKKICDLLITACPNSLTRNWVQEAKRWIPDLKLSLPPEKKTERDRYLSRLAAGDTGDLDGIVINYELLRLETVLPQVQSAARRRKTLLCLDESQRVKNPRSKTFKALVRLSQSCRRRVLLTGTPAPKDISDIWAQMMVLDHGKRLGSNFYEWLSTVAELGNRWSEFAVKRFKEDEVKEAIIRVNEVLLRRKKEEVIDLPEKTFITRYVPLRGDQRKRFDEIRKELLLRVTSTTGKTFVREISTILEEYLRAVQVASNPRLIDPAWKGEPAKFIELDEIVTEIVKEKEEKIVLWTNYRDNILELTGRYKKYGCAPFYGDIPPAERNRTIADFQDPAGRIKILAAIPAAGGVGITLTAAQTAVYIDKTWNAEHWLQSIDRIHRIGQRGTVNIISLHSTRVDELISANLKRKSRHQAELLGDSPLTPVELYPSRAELLKALGLKVTADEASL